jgi:hypothetical protein
VGHSPYLYARIFLCFPEQAKYSGRFFSKRLEARGRNRLRYMYRPSADCLATNRSARS